MTDQYGLCEAALMAKVRTLTAFFEKEWQVSDDVSMIQQGADYFFIVIPDAFPNTRADGRSLIYNWVVLADVYVRYSTAHESLQKFKTLRSALINLLTPMSLNQAKNVSRTVLSANGPMLQDIAGDNPNFLIQTISVTITQMVPF
jgi:hypothetical protein